MTAAHLEHELSISRCCSDLKNLVQDKAFWLTADFSANSLGIWDILKRLKYITVGTKSLKLKGDCCKENLQKRPMPNRQTFKEIIKRIVERSPILRHLYFDRIWFDWTKDVSDVIYLCCPHDLIIFGNLLLSLISKCFLQT